MPGMNLSNVSFPNSTYLDHIEDALRARPETIFRATYQNSVLRWLLRTVIGADPENGTASERKSSSNQQSVDRVSDSTVVRSDKRENEAENHSREYCRCAASISTILDFSGLAQQTTQTQTHESNHVRPSSFIAEKSSATKCASSASRCAPSVGESSGMRLRSEQARRCTS